MITRLKARGDEQVGLFDCFYGAVPPGILLQSVGS